MRKSSECCDAAKRSPDDILRGQLAALTEQADTLLSAIVNLGDGLGLLESALFGAEPCEVTTAEKPFEPLEHDRPASVLIECISRGLAHVARGLAALQKRLDATCARI